MPYFVSNIYAIIARVFLPPEPPVQGQGEGGCGHLFVGPP